MYAMSSPLVKLGGREHSVRCQRDGWGPPHTAAEAVPKTTLSDPLLYWLLDSRAGLAVDLERGVVRDCVAV